MRFLPARHDLVFGGAIALTCIGLAVGTHRILSSTVDRMVRRDAEHAALGWGRYLAANLKDIERIAAGEQPRRESIEFIRRADAVGQVFRFKLFDASGRLRLVSDELGQTWDSEPMLAVHNPKAAAVVLTGRPHTEVKQGTPPARPPLYAETYVPVAVDGRTIGIVEVYLDQTDKQALFREQFAIAGASLALLTAISFGIPGIAFYSRSRDKKKADERIVFLAHHDGLTGLLNRVTMVDCLERALAECRAAGEPLAVHYIDLDKFKEVNDTLGHDLGDELIRAAAERLTSAIQPGDLAGRLGGDEFVIVQRRIHVHGQAEAFARHLVDTLAQPFSIKGHDVACSASLGVAIAPQDGESAGALLKSADLALYVAKAAGRNGFRTFEPEMDDELRARRRLERIIRDATVNEGFDLYFQPIMGAPDNGLSGFEALLRLPDGAGGLISPDAFVPIAEEMGLISRIGAWVVRHTCSVATTWPDHLSVSVNLSPAQFADGRLCDVIRSALETSGLEPRRLELEITEGLLLTETEAVLDQLQSLKALGISIAMDDFGTGYSSLSYLWRFPFDKLKIDRSFMRALDARDESVANILRTIISLGHSLGMRVTAEGVETNDQAEFLQSLACDYIQGYHFGRPMSLADISAKLLVEFRAANVPDRTGAATSQAA